MSAGAGLIGNGGMPQEPARRITRFLKAKYPFFWNRYGGADHVIWATGASCGGITRV